MLAGQANPVMTGRNETGSLVHMGAKRALRNFCMRAALDTPNNMNVLTFSEARASFKQAMDDVCVHHEPTVITRQRGAHVVMMSLEDYNSMVETMHLLGNAKNATRLMESIAQLKAGHAQFRELLGNEHKERQEQE